MTFPHLIAAGREAYTLGAQHLRWVSEVQIESNFDLRSPGQLFSRRGSASCVEWGGPERSSRRVASRHTIPATSLLVTPVTSNSALVRTDRAHLVFIPFRAGRRTARR